MAIEFTDFDVIIVLSLMMLIIGFYGLVSKKSSIKVVMAIEILVSAPNLVLIAIGFAQPGIIRGFVDPKYITEAYVIIALSVGAAIIGLALAFLRNLWKHFQTMEVDAYTTLKG